MILHTHLANEQTKKKEDAGEPSVFVIDKEYCLNFAKVKTHLLSNVSFHIPNN